MKAMWLCGLALASCAHKEAAPQLEQHARTAEPSLAGWTAFETNGQGKAAKWRALRGEDGDAQFGVESSNGEQTFNLLLSDESFGPDVAITTRVRADAGTTDRGGGLVWRAKDASNYYVARWNPLENDVRVYFVRDGVRVPLATADVRLDPAATHDFATRMVGEHVTVALDGREYLALDDATFADAGKVGLWSEADASSTFTVPKVETLGR